MKQAGEAVSGAMSSNKKIADMKPNLRDPTSSDFVTSDFGVKQNTHDNWLSATTGDRQGPALLEDNWGREKVLSRLVLQTSWILDLSHIPADYEIRP